MVRQVFKLVEEIIRQNDTFVLLSEDEWLVLKLYTVNIM
jgi:hypothetical protein